jgi:hypothetical protein
VLIASVQFATGQGLYGSSSNTSSGIGSNTTSHFVAPHVNSKGTLVDGHFKSNPNNTQLDNYSTRSNVNPYTGAVGTRTPKY